MKTTLLAAVAAISLSSAAHADSGYVETCTLGNNDQVHVAYDMNARTWSIRHALQTGIVVFRETQYAIADQTTFSGGLYYPKWVGQHRKAQAIEMVGWLGMQNGVPMYSEQIWKNGAVTFQDQ